MKRTLGYGIGCAALVWLVVASCSNPLEVQEDTSSQNPVFSTDTIKVLDTISVADTVWLADSLCQDTIIIRECLDTVFVGDTVTVSDTVFVGDTITVSDTVFVGDTIEVTDTVLVTDTLRLSDTVVVTDTVRSVDTVVVTDTVIVKDCDDDEDDGGQCSKHCSKLSSKHKVITWCLDNEAGRYKLDFTAWTEKDQPAQKLWIEVGGQKYAWTPSQGKHFTLELDLSDETCVKVWSDSPHAYGHEIKVCLSLTEL